MASTPHLGYMAGASTLRHTTTLCGAILTTRGTIGIGMYAITLTIGVVVTMQDIIRTTITVTIHTILHTISQVQGIGSKPRSVATQRRATVRQLRATPEVACRLQP